MSHLASPLRRAFGDSGTRSAAPYTETNPMTMTEPSVRSSAMLLMYEELARARMSERQEDARHYRRCARLQAARRSQRRAEQAARRSQRKAEQAARRARQAQSAIW
jgi:hypothetical protein